MSRSLQNELDSLKQDLLGLSSVVEDNVGKSVKAISEKNAVLANEVISTDDRIDLDEVVIEERCLQIMALHQPVANDLRFLVAALKINNDLERIGDLSVNLAEQAIYLNSKRPMPAPFDFDQMAQQTRHMLRLAFESLIKADTELAFHVCKEDHVVDTINREVYDKVYAGIRKDPTYAEELIHYLSISKNLERIADYATNIAEDVIYMVDGVIVRHSARASA